MLTFRPDDDTGMALPVPAFGDQAPTADAGRLREIFVYYLVDVAAAATLAVAVRDAQAALVRRHPGLVARLLEREQPERPEQRDDAGDATQTWMETYAFDGERDAGIGPDLQLLIESEMAATVTGRVGARHVEVFFVEAH